MRQVKILDHAARYLVLSAELQARKFVFDGVAVSRVTGKPYYATSPAAPLITAGREIDGDL